MSFSKKFDKQIEKVPRAIQEKFQAWLFELKMVGLRTARLKKSYQDEPLQGKRWGQRSIRLNLSYRLIYEVIEDEVHILLLEVNKHDY